MNKREAYRLGRERGHNIASWVDLPEIGQKVSRFIDWVGIGDKIETVEQAYEYFMCLCQSAEQNSRDYTPFEFTAAEFNRSRNADSLWEQFERGIQVGFERCWHQRKAYYHG